MSSRTYQTRVVLTAEVDLLLRRYAALFGQIKRELHARVEQSAAAGAPCTVASFKNAALLKYGITGRQFNAIEVELSGQRAAVIEARALHLETLTDQIKRLGAKIAELEKTLRLGRLSRDGQRRVKLTRQGLAGAKVSLHGKKRRLHRLNVKRQALEEEIRVGRVPLCFGSRNLFGQQYHLKEHGFRSHAEWLTAWRAARSLNFFVIGSKGETGGCQGCTATVATDGSLALRLRLPDTLATVDRKHVDVSGLRFAYGHEAVLQALGANSARKELERAERQLAKKEKRVYSEKKVAAGTALSYRFVRDAKGWRVLVTLDAVQAPLVSQRAAGALGVDINADHLAVAEIDGTGNLIKARRIDCVTQGKSTQQALAAIGEAVAVLMDGAKTTRKPIVLERLDFTGKKRALKEQSAGYARMLSSFAYSKIQSLIEARAQDAGIEIGYVNPAFTSVIGRVKYSVSKGITPHEAAALVIGRRFQGARERALQPGKVLLVPVAGGCMAWGVPDWTLPQHRSRPWRRIAQGLSGLYHASSVRRRKSWQKRRPRGLLRASR